jgi:hypothetical protein
MEITKEQSLEDLKQIHIGNCLEVLKEYTTKQSINRVGDFLVIEDVLSEYKDVKETVFKLSDGYYVRKSQLDNKTSSMLKYN